MLYMHRGNKELYKVIGDSFSVERQRPSKVYVHLKTGAMFDRDAEAFARHFDYLGDAQLGIVPKDPHK